jgi:hypothetical protein
MEGFLLRNRVEWDRLRHALAGIYGVPVRGVEEFDYECRTTQNAPILVELYEHENGCRLNITIYAAMAARLSFGRRKILQHLNWDGNDVWVIPRSRYSDYTGQKLNRPRQ